MKRVERIFFVEKGTNRLLFGKSYGPARSMGTLRFLNLNRDKRNISFFSVTDATLEIDVGQL